MNQDITFTQEWWKTLLKDEARLATWLQKLQLTEAGGYYDWVDTLMPRFRDELSARAEAILTNIANDELKHAGLLIDLMTDRGIKGLTTQAPGMKSQYWEDMYQEIDSLSTACAVNYYGEALAAFRFEVIADMKETPGDIKEFLRLALPDEQFHRETLKRLAGDAALEQIKSTHEAAVKRLRRQ
jgi:ferritin